MWSSIGRENILDNIQPLLIVNNKKVSNNNNSEQKRKSVPQHTYGGAGGEEL
jgi:hypothetical protein